MIEAKIRKISRLILDGINNAKVRELAVAVIAGRRNGFAIPERDYMGEISAIANYIKSRVRFTRDPIGRELFYPPLKTLDMGVADCEDLVITLSSLLGALGYRSRLKVVAFAPGPFTHIYSLVGVPPGSPAKWIPLDLSHARPMFGWEPPGIKRSSIFET